MPEPRSLVDLCLRAIDDINRLKFVAQFEAIRERMCRLFDEKKQIAVLGKYHRNFIKLYNRGTTRSIKEYSDGEKCRVSRCYASGTIESSEEWKHGKLHGRYIHWDNNGNTDVHVIYDNGKIIQRFI